MSGTAAAVAAIISALAGAGTGIGQGVSAKRAAERTNKAAQAEANRTFKMQQEYDDYQKQVGGFDRLVELTQQGKDNTRGRLFRRQLLQAATGGV